MSLLLPASDAIREREKGRKLALNGEIGEACFRLALAAISLHKAGQDLEAVRTGVLLGWVQDIDGRPWQAARTLREAVSSPEFELLTARVQARALYTYARALWFLGDYGESLARAQEAYAIAEGNDDRGRAALAVAQAALCLGMPSRAEEAFEQAIHLDASLRVAAYGIRAYLHNLAGQHHEALKEAEAGLRAIGYPQLEKPDNTGRAVESSALLVELGTAKAFLGMADARQAILEARNLLRDGPGNADLELARTSRAMAMVLARCGECPAASALLTDASKVFSRRGVQSEHGLTFRVLKYVARKEGMTHEDPP